MLHGIPCSLASIDRWNAFFVTCSHPIIGNAAAKPFLMRNGSKKPGKETFAVKENIAIANSGITSSDFLFAIIATRFFRRMRNGGQFLGPRLAKILQKVHQLFARSAASASYFRTKVSMRTNGTLQVQSFRIFIFPGREMRFRASSYGMPKRCRISSKF